VPFVAPGGPVVPLAAAAIIVWMLSTLAARELAAAALLLGTSALVYGIESVRHRRRLRSEAAARTGLPGA
jgi:hypothetical protein